MDEEKRSIANVINRGRFCRKFIVDSFEIVSWEVPVVAERKVGPNYVIFDQLMQSVICTRQNAYHLDILVGSINLLKYRVLESLLRILFLLSGTNARD